jgi:hypothetical protein
MNWSVIQMSDGLTTVVARKGQYWAAARFHSGANEYELKHWQKWAESTLEAITKRWPQASSMTKKQIATISQLKPQRTLGHVILDVGDLAMIGLRVLAVHRGILREFIIADHEGHIYMAIYPYLSDLRVCQAIAPPT